MFPAYIIPLCDASDSNPSTAVQQWSIIHTFFSLEKGHSSKALNTGCFIPLTKNKKKKSVIYAIFKKVLFPFDLVVTSLLSGIINMHKQTFLFQLEQK